MTKWHKVEWVNQNTRVRTSALHLIANWLDRFIHSSTFWLTLLPPPPSAVSTKKHAIRMHVDFCDRHRLQNVHSSIMHYHRDTNIIYILKIKIEEFCVLMMILSFLRRNIRSSAKHTQRFMTLFFVSAWAGYIYFVNNSQQ